VLKISEETILERIATENPWWKADRTIGFSQRAMKPRAYLDLFFPLVSSRAVRRAVVLMGPRRVGKTVMIHHTVQALIDSGIRPETICYLSVDHPIYTGLSLETLLNYYSQASGVDYKSTPTYVFFDEIQYLRNWEVHLKSVVDTYPLIKCTASGSAAAALRLKSNESGAGRFTDFLLPPLTFYEYLDLLNETHLVESISVDDRDGLFFYAQDIDALNEQFLNYLNFGGYPEVIVSPVIRADATRFIKSDIIDKVLLRDLPSLYGIGDIQELNYLFTTLAFNTANEISLGELSQNSGVAKNTIKRYIEYLEAAFLIKIVHRVDRNAKRFDRANFFKVYLTNPSMRAALFSPLHVDDREAVGALAETAIFSQWFHAEVALYYARWADGEVDIVYLKTSTQKPAWAIEVKWSDRYCSNPDQLKSLISFCHANGLTKVIVTSKTKSMCCEIGDLKVTFVPASTYCYMVGYNVIRRGRKAVALKEQLEIASAPSPDVAEPPQPPPVNSSAEP
jgi:uncharacterized protein